MKYLIALLFLATPALAIDTRIINSTNNPVNVTGNITTTVSTHTFVDNFPATYTVTPGSGTFVVNTSTHVSVDNFPASQAVTGTFFQATQPVSFTTPFSVLVATVSALISGSSNTVQITGTPSVNSTSVNVTTVTFNSIAQPVSFTLGTSTTAVVPLRPSQWLGTTYKAGLLDNLTTNATAYTVTTGKTLYVTSLNISGYNGSTTNAGDIDIQDGSVNRIPLSIPTAGVGALASQIPVSALQFIFQEPKQFSTNINVNIKTGTITYSFDFTGYEE